MKQRGARGSSAFRASLDAEYRIRREDAGSEALVISCTKMKDAEELKEAAYDLRVVELFTDADGELITSLVVVDKPRPPVELERIEEAGEQDGESRRAMAVHQNTNSTRGGVHYRPSPRRYEKAGV